MVPDFYFPYLINYSQPDIEHIVILCVGFLTAILVNAEGQGFIATLLGDSRQQPKDRLHFNVFMHLSVLGTINFLVAGFGWPKELDLDETKYKSHPRLFLVLTRIAGPAFNLLMANIAASLAWILGKYDFEDQVFSTIVVVNITMAIYGLLIPLAPLPGAAVLNGLLPSGRFRDDMQRYLARVGPYIIIVGFLLIRISGWDGVSSFFTPIVEYLTIFALDI
jgi:hypothetical protein